MHLNWYWCRSYMKLLEGAKLRLAVIHALKVNSTIFVNSAFPCSTPQHCKLETFTIKKTSVTKNISMWCWTIWCKRLLNNRYFIQCTLSFKLGLHFSTFFSVNICIVTITWPLLLQYYWLKFCQGHVYRYWIGLNTVLTKHVEYIHV